MKAANLAQKPLIRNAEGACRESAAVGRGVNEGGSCGERAKKEWQYREACVALAPGQTKGSRMHYITLQWKANISGIGASML